MTASRRLGFASITMIACVLHSHPAQAQIRPGVVTLPAGNLAAAGTNAIAVFSGTVNPNGLSTAAWFEWGHRGGCGNRSDFVNVGSGVGATNLSLALTNLIPGQVYRCRLLALNSQSIVRGRDQVFWTPGINLSGAEPTTNVCHQPYVAPNVGVRTAPRQLTAGFYHNFILETDGTLTGWGQNDQGQTNVPAGLTNVVAVDSGGWHNLALKADGTVTAWGLNGSGQAGVPSNATNVVAVCAGSWHSLALRTNGSVVAWGQNYYGQTTVPAAASNVVAIAAGDGHSLALRSDGAVVGWGNTYATAPATASNVVAIAAGSTHSLALLGDGTVVGWGDNTYGQTGVPAAATNVVAIAAGGGFSMALKDDGTVLTWGATNAGYSIAVPAEATNVVAIAGGWYHCVAVKADGSIVGWGNYVSGPTNLDSPGLTASMTGFVDTNTPGIYTLNYTVTNASGTVATATRTVVVAAIRPWLSNPERLVDGSFRLSFTNTPGEPFDVLASTNLALPLDAWTPLGPAIEGPAGQFHFTDAGATNHPLRFYLLRGR